MSSTSQKLPGRMLRVYLAVTTIAIFMAPSSAWAIPVAAITAITSLTGFAAAAVTFIVNTAISPAVHTEGWHGGASIISSKPMRARSIAPIGSCTLPAFGPFMVAITTGDCMAPVLDDRAYLIIDKRMAIRSGDLVTLRLRPSASGAIITKRFIEAYDDVLSCAQNNPSSRLDFAISDIEWAYRVRSVARNFISACWTMLVATFSPRTFNERLGIYR
ncbi:S24 family peptidase [Sphingobium naphthae]|nr:S24 family peptidase [Sphingobium naphthae]